MSAPKKLDSQDKQISTQKSSDAPKVTARNRSALKKLVDAHLRSPAPKVVKNGKNYQRKETDKLGVPFVQALGSGDPDFIHYQLNHLINVAQQDFAPMEINGLLAFMHGLAPRDEIESFIVSQMAAVHELAMTCLRRAAKSDDAAVVEMKLNQANKLLRTFALQTETLNRYRGKGQQKVTVEHVNVHQGGQAIVGVVHPPRRGEGD